MSKRDLEATKHELADEGFSDRLWSSMADRCVQDTACGPGNIGCLEFSRQDPSLVHVWDLLEEERIFLDSLPSAVLPGVSCGVDQAN